jgi:anti-sigma-K factor RskA
MGISNVQDWDMDSIMKRDIRVSDEVIAILNRWNKEYLNIPTEASADEPSDEDLARIDEFKKRGWI